MSYTTNELALLNLTNNISKIFYYVGEVERDDTFMTQQTGIVTRDTKGQGPFGLFRHLPAELRRAGNNVFNQAKNRLNPVGRVFGGKVFPPF